MYCYSMAGFPCLLDWILLRAEAEIVLILGKTHRAPEILYSPLFICLNLMLILNIAGILWRLGDCQIMLKYFHQKIHVKCNNLLPFCRTLVTPSGYIRLWTNIHYKIYAKLLFLIKTGAQRTHGKTVWGPCAFVSYIFCLYFRLTSLNKLK